MSLTNKVALVTGSSGGIGAAIAVLFAKEGADVAIVGRNEEKLKNVAEACEKSGKKPLVIKADISKDDEAKDIVEKTIETYGKLDILVNNAGILRYGSIKDGKILEAYDEIMNTNVRAVIQITTLAAPYLVKTKGNIVNISSIASLSIFMEVGIAYCVSKAALDHFTRGAALELAASGVRVNSVNPGPTKTDLFKTCGFSADDSVLDDMKHIAALGKLAKSEEIADLVLFLSSNKAKSITGSTYVCDNGCILKR